MRKYFQEQTLREIHAGVYRAVEQLRLPLRSFVWRGRTGQFLGPGMGSSIDFQDHRPYSPGDDPRYIDWNAYARSGHYTMKLYREEISPHVDIALDISESMFFEDTKHRRTLELFYFFLESGTRMGASLRLYLMWGGNFVELPLDLALHHRFLLPQAPACVDEPPVLAPLPWRAGALRVFISDLLFQEAPENVVALLCTRKGRGIILSPFSSSEAHPRWEGNVRFIDCETKKRSFRRIEPEVMNRYHQLYARHFGMWSEVAQKHAVPFARIPAEGDFQTAIQSEALRVGAVETWN